MILVSLESFLIKHEANRLKPYMDCCDKPWRECECINKGKLTIGVGRNLDDNGISADESHYMLKNDISRTVAQCRQQLPWFDGLNDARKMVIVDMVLNMGMGGFLAFHDTIGAIEEGDFKLAASQMLNSLWALKVGLRAIEDAHILETGTYYDG